MSINVDQGTIMTLMSMMQNMQNQLTTNQQSMQNQMDELQKSCIDARNDDRDKFMRKLDDKDKEIKDKDKEIKDKDKEIKDKDNDIQNMNKTIDDLNDNINNLNEEINDLNDNINDLNEEINEKDDKINDLNEENEQKNQVVALKIYDYMKENTVILHNKGDYDKYIIKDNSLSKDQTKHAIETTKYYLNLYGGNITAAESICKRFEAIYGGQWTCLISINGSNDHCGAISYRYVRNYKISFAMGEFYILIYKSDS